MKILKMYAYSFFNTFFIYMPYLALYLALNKDLSNNQIAIILSGFSFSVFIFEIPTGYIADKIGAKKSLIIGFCIRLLGIITLTFGNLFSMIFLGEVLLGLGSTFSSGADQSLLYKIVLDDNEKKDKYNKIVSNYYTISWIGITISFLCGQFLAKISYSSIFYTSIFVTLFGLIITLILPNNEAIVKNNETFSIIKDAYFDIRHNYQLRQIFIVSSLIFAILASSYLLFQPLLNEINIASVNNGMLFFVITIFAIIGSKIQPHLVKKLTSHLGVLFIILLSAIIFSIGLLRGSIFILALCVFRLIWGIFTPLISTEINQLITKKESRSTILSIQSLIANLFQGIILILAGIIPSTISMKLSVIGFLVFPLGILLLIQSRKLTTAST